MIYEVDDDNRLIKVKGNPDHPMTNGMLCVKLKDYEKGIIIKIDSYIRIKE